MAAAALSGIPRAAVLPGDPFAALVHLGAAHRTDAERVPLARARGRILAETLDAGGLRFEAGQRLRPEDLGALAAAGQPDLSCARRPTVAVFTSGDALRPPGQPLAAGERFDACRAVLVALLQEAGLEPVAWPILPTDPLRASTALRDAAQAFDLIVSCGPVDADGRPTLAALFDPRDAAMAVAVTLGGVAADAATVVAAPFGERATRAVLIAWPDDAAALAEAWPRVGLPVLDAMQGVARPRAPLEIEASELEGWLAAGTRLVDVRDADEWALTRPSGAEWLPLAEIQREPGRILAAADAPTPAKGAAPSILLICATGRRSLRAAQWLRDAGVAEGISVRGGLAAWRAAGRAVEPVGDHPAIGLEADALERYDRHLRLAGVGPQGQALLAAARVVIVGAGGLGSPAAFYLAAAGVGRLVLVDDDRVERSNLQRQILHVDAAVGHSKVSSARERLTALNPAIEVSAIEARLGPDNVEAVLRGADVVIDGSDNFATRFLVDAACVRLGLPLVYGAVERFTGQVSVFDAGRRRGVAPCYRCLFPEPPGADAAPNCAEAGVLGVLPGLVGLLQATEALKLVLGIGDPLVGRLLTVDALAMRFRTLELPVDPGCPGCGSDAVFAGYPALEAYCASR